MEYLTGKKGTPHFTSEQFRTILAAIGGTGSYIAKLHEELEPELAVNNTIKIRSGLLMHHGGIFLINQGTYDEVNYQNGTQGMNRIDLVVARYTKNAETGIEEGEWVVIQGTPDAQNPTAPAYIAGDMQNGDLIDDCPFLEVHFNGINVTEIKKLVAVTPNIDGLEKEITELNGKLENIKITWTEYNKTITENNYVQPYTYYGTFEIPEEHIEKYGQPISVSATGSSGKPIPVAFDYSFKGYIVTSSGNGEIKVRVVFLKI